MFGKKDKRDKYAMGALRSASPPTAPTLQFRNSGREAKVDLRQFCSPVEDQNPLGSCNACAVVGALEYLELKDRKPLKDLSILYVYYYGRLLGGKVNEDSGLMCHHATAAVMAYGCAEDRLWPYKPEKFTQEPSKAAQDNATKYNAWQYARVGTEEEAKASMSQGLPVIVGLDIPRPYYDAAEATGVMPPVGSFDTAPFAGHTMLFVGYDDTARTWLVRNSWGKSWGEQGYLHIPYDLAAKYVWNDEMWVIGALEKVERARLVGPSTQEAVRSVQARGAEEMDAALKKLREDYGKEMEDHTEAAKTSIRDRLRAQEDKLGQRRDGGGDEGNR